TLEDTVRFGRKVHKFQILSGPDKPKLGEEIPTVQQPGAASRIRQTFWTDSTTNLPVHSEYEKWIQGRWELLVKSDYAYNRPVLAQLFNPEAVRKAAKAFGAHKR